MSARSIAVATLLALAAGSALAAEPSGLRFDQVFRAEDGRAPLHYRASYVARGAEHQVEVWIDGARLKRVTDGAVELHAERQPGDADFGMTVLDLQRKISTRVDSASLERLGHSLGWGELAQGLRQPRGDYRLERIAAPAVNANPVRSCEWYALAQAGHTTRICWQAEARLPMLIADAQGQWIWRVTELDRQPIAASVLDVHDDGFVRNDASGDIADD